VNKVDGKNAALSIIAAMAGVKDVKIDPLTGATTKNSGGSILDKSVDTSKLTGNMKENVEKQKAAVIAQKKEAKGLCDAYRQMMNGGIPIVAKSDAIISEDTPNSTVAPSDKKEFNTPTGILTFRESLSNQDAILANIKKMRR